MLCRGAGRQAEISQSLRRRVWLYSDADAVFHLLQVAMLSVWQHAELFWKKPELQTSGKFLIYSPKTLEWNLSWDNLHSRRLKAAHPLIGACMCVASRLQLLICIVLILKVSAHLLGYFIILIFLTMLQIIPPQSFKCLEHPGKQELCFELPRQQCPTLIYCKWMIRMINKLELRLHGLYFPNDHITKEAKQVEK